MKTWQRRPSTIDQLESNIRQVWKNIPLPNIQQLIYISREEGMPHSGKHDPGPTFNVQHAVAIKVKMTLFFSVKYII